MQMLHLQQAIVWACEHILTLPVKKQDIDKSVHELTTRGHATFPSRMTAFHNHGAILDSVPS